MILKLLLIKSNNKSIIIKCHISFNKGLFMVMDEFESLELYEYN